MTARGAFILYCFIRFDYAFGDIAFRQAAVHRLPLDIAVSVVLGHFEVVDQEPFRAVDQIDVGDVPRISTSKS